MALNSQYMFSPNIQEVFVDPSTGLPLIGGFVYYYKDSSRSDLKTVYELSGSPGTYSFTALTNPVTLGAGGTPVNGSGADIRVYYYPYDDNGNIELYYIRVTDSDGNTMSTRQAWPNLSTSTGDSTLSYNFARNSTFYLWNHNGAEEFLNVGTGSVSLTDFMFSDWTYEQDDDSQDIDVLHGTFLAADSSIPDNPPKYLIYRNNNSGSNLGSYNRFRQTYESVKTLNGQNVAVSIWVKQTNPSTGQPFSVSFTQDFGAGGSASVETTALVEATLEYNSWVKYTGSVPLPSLTGKTIGTNDKLIINLNMPLNVASTLNISTLRVEEGLSISGTSEISNDDIKKQSNSIGLYAAWTTGDVKTTIKTVADIGWLVMDDNTIGSPLSGATHEGFSYFPLFDMIWNNVGTNLYAQIFDNAGLISTYGASSEADWQENKRLSLTKALGRILSGSAPTGVSFQKYFTSASVNVNPTNTIILNDTSPVYTGTIVQFQTTGTLPTGLSLLTDYYLIVVNGTTIQVATTLANALSGTAILLTSTGSGTMNLVATLPVSALASYLGERTHAQTTAELRAHLHNFPGTGTLGQPDQNTGPAGSSDVGTVTPGGTATLSAGGNTPFNIMQPTSFYNVHIKL